MGENHDPMIHQIFPFCTMWIIKNSPNDEFMWIIHVVSQLEPETQMDPVGTNDFRHIRHKGRTFASRSQSHCDLATAWPLKDSEHLPIEIGTIRDPFISTALSGKYLRKTHLYI